MSPHPSYRCPQLYINVKISFFKFRMSLQDHDFRTMTSGQQLQDCYQGRHSKITIPGLRLEDQDSKTTTPQSSNQNHNSKTTTPGTQTQDHKTKQTKTKHPNTKTPK